MSSGLLKEGLSTGAEIVFVSLVSMMQWDTDLKSVLRGSAMQTTAIVPKGLCLPHVKLHASYQKACPAQ
jgi:hypothetical protein